MSDFDLRKPVRDVCETTSLVGPQMLAKEVNMTITDIRASHCPSGAQRARAGADPNFPGGQGPNGHQLGLAAVDSSTRNGQTARDAHDTSAVAGPTPDQASPGAEPIGLAPDRAHSPQPANLEPQPIFEAAAGTPISSVTIGSASPIADPSPGDQDYGDQSGTGNQECGVVAPNPPGPASVPATPRVAAPVLADPLLALAADVLDDLERVRVANENRLRQLTRDETDKDGEERGFGLDLDHPDVARLAALVDALSKAEHNATLNLQRMVRKHPLGPWIAATIGVGEKQGARLLAAIGDPYWNDLHGRPRTVSELWAYCGYHVLPASQDPTDTQSTGASGGLTGGDPGQLPHGTHGVHAGVAATPKRGQRANWSTAAKMRTYLIAESCMKNRSSPYRAVYEAGRDRYADAVHATECKRCGPAGKPAPPGSPLSAGHQHARALRLVSKEILKDLWREAKRIHEEAPS